ncbi:DUF2155 domain-containing protein [Rhizobium sp. FKL33]|uniref:DUF2155 domain-containing protein n=1 Tax=Rhizobium sp. FKL33 TaxID=2562307 RepID=UPI0010C09954|nr:DUF2155 domain-containing protein [Rhizobium sp. FKL33]
MTTTSTQSTGLRTVLSAALVFGGCLLSSPAEAAKIKNAVAEFAGLDKITGRTTTFDVYMDETVQFGALQVTPRVCFSRDETEAQKQSTFVEVDEITLDRKIRRIFSGWMFAASPGLNAVDHPIYDIWLTGCKQTSDVPRPDGFKIDTTPIPDPKTEKPADGASGAPDPTMEPAPPADGETLNPDAPVDMQNLPDLTNPEQNFDDLNPN